MLLQGLVFLCKGHWKNVWITGSFGKWDSVTKISSRWLPTDWFGNATSCPSLPWKHLLTFQGNKPSNVFPWSITECLLYKASFTLEGRLDTCPSHPYMLCRYHNFGDLLLWCNSLVNIWLSLCCSLGKRGVGNLGKLR